LKDVTVIRNFPMVKELESISAAPHSTFTVGYMGAVSTERGSLLTLAALAKCQREGLKVAFDCVGPISARHRSELTAKAEDWSLADVHLHGYLAPEESWHVIARCHVGIAVLNNLPNYYDSLPTKLLEYMALGKPVIASNFPLYRSVVEKFECGICVHPDNPDEVAAAQISDRAGNSCAIAAV